MMLLHQKMMQNIPLLDSALMAWHNNRHLNGAILVALDTNIIYEEYLGWADRVKRKKIQPNTSFQVASISKVFTAILVLKLVEKNKIRLDDSVQVYLPDFPYHGITVRHLLSHQSGLPNYVYALLKKLSECQQPSNRTWYELFIHSGLKKSSDPGMKFEYCNSNYALLACLIEKVSGMSYSEFLKKEILEPLGMKHTFIYPESREKWNVCYAYTKRGKRQPEDANDYILGDKGIFSTPKDLFAFAKALHYGNLIKDELYKEATFPQAYEKNKKERAYGLGFRLKNPADSLMKDIYHNGWWHGYRSSFHYFPYPGLTIIMMSNELDVHVYYSSVLYELLMGKERKTEISAEEEM